MHSTAHRFIPFGPRLARLRVQSLAGMLFLLFTAVRPLEVRGGSNRPFVNDIFFSDAIHGWIEVVSPSGNHSLLLKTEDGGVTWRTIELTNGLYRIFFLNQNLGWGIGFSADPKAGCSTALFATRDGGINWSAQSSFSLPCPGTNPKLTALLYVDRDHGFFIGENKGGAGVAFRTNDGGKTITRVDTMKRFGETRGLLTGMNQEIWVIGETDVHISKDFGITWNVAPIGTFLNMNAGKFMPDGRGVLVGGPGTGMIFATSDSGAHWTLALKSDKAGFFKAVDFWSSDDGCAVGASRLLACTSDGGEHWVLRNVLPEASDFQKIVYAAGGQKVWVLDASANLFQSNDEGSTWTDFDFPSILSTFKW